MCSSTNDTQEKNKGSDGHSQPSEHGHDKKLLVCLGGKVFGINDIFKDGKR